jgi:hypothetical protein
MNLVAIPAWNPQGLIPPIDTLQPTGTERSPYAVTLTELVQRFGQTPARRVVLNGFLRYRAALHEAGLRQGFQWLDGSFLEHIEAIEQRAPNDLDVVTFYQLPAGRSQVDLHMLNPNIFPAGAQAREALKASYRVDCYLVHLGMAPERLVGWAAYWYSLWSHRRTGAWKGYLAVDLAPVADQEAAATLAAMDILGAF